MKRFAYRLERVRRLRYLAKREAETALARAHTAVRELCDQVENLGRRADRAAREFNAALEREQAVTGAAARESADWIAALLDTERRKRVALAQARSEVTAREREFLDAKRAYDVLQKLREKKRREWIADVEREEQLRLDELHRSRSKENDQEMRLS